jgi:hypothetical protein
MPFPAKIVVYMYPDDLAELQFHLLSFAHVRSQRVETCVGANRKMTVNIRIVIL